MEIEAALKALDSLAQRSRLEAFRLLVRCGPDGLAAGEIAERLEVPPATLSFHLNHLVNAGLVQSRREGRSIIYSIRVEPVHELMRYLTQECCEGRPDLCGYGSEPCCETTDATDG